MNCGDLLVIDGGVPHRGIAYPGKIKIYYNLEKTNDANDIVQGEPYEHETQIDMLEVWVILGQEVYSSLSHDLRKLFLRHVIMALALVSCQNHVVHSRYDDFVVGRIFDELEVIFLRKMVTGSKTGITSQSPVDMFAPTADLNTKNQPIYKITKKFENAINEMYDFALRVKLYEIDYLFQQGRRRIQFDNMNVGPRNCKIRKKKNVEQNSEKSANNDSVPFEVAVDEQDPDRVYLLEKDRKKERFVHPLSLTSSSVRKITGDDDSADTLIVVKVYADISSKEGHPSDYAEQILCEGISGRILKANKSKTITKKRKFEK